MKCTGAPWFALMQNFEGDTLGNQVDADVSNFFEINVFSKNLYKLCITRF